MVICITKNAASTTVGLGLWVVCLPAQKQNIKLGVYSREAPKLRLPYLVGEEAVEAIIANGQGRTPRESQLLNMAYLALRTQSTAGQGLLVALLPR